MFDVFNLDVTKLVETLEKINSTLKGVLKTMSNSNEILSRMESSFAKIESAVTAETEEVKAENTRLQAEIERLKAEGVDVTRLTAIADRLDSVPTNISNIFASAPTGGESGSTTSEEPTDDEEPSGGGPILSDSAPTGDPTAEATKAISEELAVGETSPFSNEAVSASETTSTGDATSDFGGVSPATPKDE